MEKNDVLEAVVEVVRLQIQRSEMRQHFYEKRLELLQSLPTPTEFGKEIAECFAEIKSSKDTVEKLAEILNVFGSAI